MRLLGTTQGAGIFQLSHVVLCREPRTFQDLEGKPQEGHAATDCHNDINDARPSDHEATEVVWSCGFRFFQTFHTREVRTACPKSADICGVRPAKHREFSGDHLVGEKGPIRFKTML